MIEPGPTYGQCQRCKRQADRAYITTSAGRLLVCIDCYEAFKNLPPGHPGRP